MNGFTPFLLSCLLFILLSCFTSYHIWCKKQKKPSKAARLLIPDFPVSICDWEISASYKFVHWYLRWHLRMNQCVHNAVLIRSLQWWTLTGEWQRGDFYNDHGYNAKPIPIQIPLVRLFDFEVWTIPDENAKRGSLQWAGFVWPSKTELVNTGWVWLFQTIKISTDS